MKITSQHFSPEVKKPQDINLKGTTTVFQVILQAGGLIETARAEEVILIRRQADYTPRAMVINLSKVIDGTDLSQDLVLMPYDVVFVPRTPIANVNLWVDQYIRKLLPLRTNANITYEIDSTYR